MPPLPLKPSVSALKIQDVNSSKGINAWVVESHEVPVVSLALAFKNAGTAADPKGLTGLAHLLSGMLDEGAGDWDSQGFVKFLLEKNIQLSVSATQDTFQISFRTIKQNVADAFLVLNKILTQPHFAKDALNRVKNQILTSLTQSLYDEHSIAAKKLHSLIYGSHPYGKTAEEELKEFPGVEEGHLRAFMKDRFAKDQLLIAIVGDITPDEVKTLLDKAFGELPEKSAPSPLKEATFQNLGTTAVVPLDIPQSVVYFVQPGIPRNAPNFYAAFVCLKILGDGQFESRLWNEVREKRGLAYGIDASLSWSKHASVISGGTATKNASVSEVIRLIREVWQNSIEGVTQAELDFVKERMIGSFALNFSSTNRIAGALLTYQIDNLGIDFINTRNSIINSLTLDQVNQAARELLKPELLTFVVVGQPEGLSSSEGTAPKITPELKKE